MIGPAVEMAQTHADQLRRNAETWRERRQARLGTSVLAAARANVARRRADVD